MTVNIDKKIIYNPKPTEEDARQEALFRAAVEMEIQRKKLLGLPIARYDKELKKAYMEYPNGERRYAK